MSVINSEYARNVTLNGRLPTFDKSGKKIGSRIVEVQLLPGLNNVTSDQMEMLNQNDTFEFNLSVQKMSIVEHVIPAVKSEKADEPSEPAKVEEPDDIEAIDITSMSVPNAGKVIGSAATMDLLDIFEEQEKALVKPRKGVIAAIKEQRKILGSIIEKQNESKKKA